MAGLIGRVQRVAQALEHSGVLGRMTIHELVQWVSEEIEAMYPRWPAVSVEMDARAIAVHQRIAAILLEMSAPAEAGKDPGVWPADGPAIGPRLTAMIEADHAAWLAEQGKRR